jgi:hypothetical protein
MDEKEIAKIGMEVVLRPVTDVAENVIGVLGGDWLSEKRRLNREKLKAKTDEALKRADVKEPVEPSPSVALPLLSEAQNESRDELLDIWAELLAAAMNPKRSNMYRREFVNIVQQLEPLDVQVLPLLVDGTLYDPSRQFHISHRLGVTEEQVLLSFRNLRRLDLTEDRPGAALGAKPTATVLGKQLLAVVNR